MRFEQAVYKALVRTASVATGPRTGAVWDRAWSTLTPAMSHPVVMPLHGRRAIMNAGYAYPAFRRRWAGYNDPLVEIVHRMSEARNAPVVVVDVGAAIGDTVLLLVDRCPDDLKGIHCIEGDAEFFSYLRRNVASLPHTELHFVMLSDSEGEEAELVRTHPGTASAQGPGRQATKTLDAVLSDVSSVDVLKIDTDGFDGKVLAGAERVLREQRPAVIFEWHPLLYRATGQDWRRPFELLTKHEYEWFAWFTKEGEFSHINAEYERASVEILAEVCLSETGPRPDWHYDVVALPTGSGIDVAQLAGLTFARQRSGRSA